MNDTIRRRISLCRELAQLNKQLAKISNHPNAYPERLDLYKAIQEIYSQLTELRVQKMTAL
jgi:hypothetical protein